MENQQPFPVEWQKSLMGQVVTPVQATAGCGDYTKSTARPPLINLEMGGCANCVLLDFRVLGIIV